MSTKKECFKLDERISQEIYDKYGKGQMIDLGDGCVLYDVPSPFGVWGSGKNNNDLVVIKDKTVIKTLEEAMEYLKTIWVQPGMPVNEK
jgi:hypothetical protein